MTVIEPSTTAATVQVRADAAPLPGGPLILHVDGELETQTATEFSSVLTAAAGAYGAPDVLLDLGRLYRLDIAGLDAIAESAAALAREGRRLVLACVRPRVREFLGMVGGEALVPVFPTLEEATAHM